MQEQTIEGRVETIIFESEDATFKIAGFTDNEGNDFIIKGNLISCNEGDRIKIVGEWTEHQKYGTQFNCFSYTPITPSDKDEIFQFLSSGAIEGIGERYAERIVDKFGDKSLEVLEKNPERYLEIEGIGRKTLQKILTSYKDTFYLKSTLMELLSYGISTNLAMKLFNKYKENTLDVLKQNPYQICKDIKGIGFIKADEIAIKMGADLDSDERKIEAIIYCLNQGTYDGNTFMYFYQVYNALKKLINNITEEIIYKLLIDMYIDRTIILEPFDNKLDIKHIKDLSNLKIYLYKYAFAESKSASGIVRILTHTEENLDEESAKEIISRELKKQSLELSDEQIESCFKALTNKILIITGGPGTGKTTVINFIVQVFESIGKTIKLAAPTGKASKRMSYTTGRSASTVHRMLGMGIGDIEFEEETFSKNEDDPIKADVIIVDEASMIDIILFKNLISAVKDSSKIIFVGDKDQLPSVGAGNVLKDLINSDLIPKIFLTKIFRQAKESNIVLNAHRINKGENLLKNDRDKDFFLIDVKSEDDAEKLLIKYVDENLPNYYGMDKRDIQIITPMKKNKLGTQRLNSIMQSVLNPKSDEKEEIVFAKRIYRKGDRVIHVKNNYEKEWTIDEEKGKGVFNGETGNILAINKNEKSLIVLFDDGKKVFYEYNSLIELEHAFALTVHKSQGSEYPYVILPIYKVSPMLLTRKILYTAITRAEKLLVILSEKNTIDKMIKNVYSNERNSSLEEKIKKFTSFLLEE